MTGFTVSDAVPSDAADLGLILGDWIRETGWMPVLHSREDDRVFLGGLIETHLVRVVRHGETTLGFIARKGGEIDALYLGSAARGRGIGKALVDEVKATEPLASLWTFQANTGAIAFYRREGFIEAERTDGRGNDERLPDIRMTWRSGA